MVPDPGGKSDGICVTYDGYTAVYDDVEEIEVTFSDIVINLMRFENYDFWTKVKKQIPVIEVSMSKTKFQYTVTPEDQGLPVKPLLRRRFSFSSRLLTKL